MKLTVVSIVVFLSLTAIVQADTIAVSRFETDGLAGWERKSFKGETEYSVVREGEDSVIKARSRDAASGLFRKVRLDPIQYRFLRWKWKVDEPLGGGAEKTRSGDDYSARVYVIFPGIYPSPYR